MRPERSNCHDGDEDTRIGAEEVERQGEGGRVPGEEKSEREWEERG